MRRHRNGHSRQWWRRLERKAIAAYERDLLVELQQLAEERAHCLVLAEGADNPAGVLRLLLQQQRLSMAEVLPSRRRALQAMQAGGPLQLTGGGRYGRLWWIALSNGLVHMVVAGSQVRLSGDAGGAAFTEDAFSTPPNEESLPDVFATLRREQL
jgi:hypothetical protein